MIQPEIITKIDALASQNIPFFVMISFDGTEVYIKKWDEIDNQQLQFEFRNFHSNTKLNSENRAIEITPNPVSRSEYTAVFDKVIKEIRYGNSYLTNVTFETPIVVNATLREIYNQAKAKYKVYLHNRFVCFSPETFISIQGETISTFPMKGTIDASIPNAEILLKENQKEQQEHNTIVDLLRNDMSTIAEKVHVKQFRYIEEITTEKGTILQMSSEIQGSILPEFRGKIGTILSKMLPAGSISGAPKEKTMEIITENETHKRGFYTGIMGIYDGKNFDSAVLIRFIEQRNQQLYYKSGGGITHKSNPEEEYNEMLQKIYVPTV